MIAARRHPAVARIGNLLRLENVGGLVAPRIALERDDRRDFDVVQRRAPRGHRALAVQHDVHVTRERTVGDLAAVERRERARALAVRLVADRAVRRVDLLAARLQFVHRVRLVGIVGGGRQFLLLVLDPLRVVVGGQHFHDDRHVRVLLAAQFGAEAAERADLVRLEPRVAHEAGDRVLLHAERRHIPRVDDVVGGGDDADFLVDRHDERVVDFLQVEIRDRRLAVRFATRRGERGQEVDAFARTLHVVVGPLPLIAGDLDGEVGVGRVLHRDDGFRGGQRHQDDDHERHDRPDDFDGGAFVEIGRLVASRLAVREERIEHHAEHAEEDHETDDQHERVEAKELLGDLRRGLLEVELVDTRTARSVGDRQGCTGREQSACRQHAREGSLDCFHSILTQNFHSNPRPPCASVARPRFPFPEPGRRSSRRRDIQTFRRSA
ncbi:hypothetical protein AWB68_06776 [Caballeronia choica]|uniref:Uncharacterized protein n=1 Tax=Caballeronia choica TaxID=326476 RepID=A0A158KPU2_9BURK|nr:hypothetical protein AWB68_06776 [Caballeronia choica]